MAIRENELSNSRERITNPWERIEQFVITIYLIAFFENPHVPSGLSYKIGSVVQEIYHPVVIMGIELGS